MPITLPRPEWLALLAMLVFALAQVVLTSSDVARAARRNFEATFPIFVASVLGLAVLHGFGRFSLNGAVIYAVARGLYLAMTYVAKPLRSSAWALSIAGLLGCVGQLGVALAGGATG